MVIVGKPKNLKFVENRCLLKFSPSKKPQNKTHTHTQKKYTQTSKQPSEMSVRQIQKKGNSEAQSVYDRPLFPCAVPMIQAKQLHIKNENNEGILWLLP